MSRLSAIYLTFVLFVTGIAYAQTVRSVQVEPQDGSTTVTIQGSALRAPAVHLWRDRYLVIEFSARLEGKGRTMRVGSPHVSSLKYGWYTSKPPQVRVVLALRGKPPYHVTKTETGYQVRLGKKENQQSAVGNPKSEIRNPKSEIQTPNGRVGERENESVESLRPHVPIEEEINPNPVDSEPRIPKEATIANPTPPAKTFEPVQVASATPISPPTTPSPSKPSDPPSAPPLSSPSSSYQPLISLDFVGAEIGDVLKALAIQSGTNIVTGNDVTGTVTVSLNRVTVEEALDLITRLSGFQHKRIGSTYLVGTSKSLAALGAEPGARSKDETMVEVVRIQYGDLETIQRAVEQIMDNIAEEGQLNVFTSANKQDKGGDSGKEGNQSTKTWDPRQDRFLILTGSPALVPIAKETAERLDREFGKAIATGHVIQVYQAKHVDALTLRDVLEGKLEVPGRTSGGSGGSGGGGGGAGGGGGGGGEKDGKVVYPLFPTVRLSVGPTPAISRHSVSTAQVSGGAQASSAAENNNLATEPPMSLILQGPESDVNRALEFVRQIDVAAPQVRIEARVADLSSQALKSIGFSWEILQSKDVSKFTDRSKNPVVVDPSDPKFIPNQQSIDFNKVGDLGIGFGLIKDSLGLTAKLNALFEDRRNRLLASPSVSVLDGRYAEIFIGDEVFYVESISQTPTGLSITTNRVKAGIQLNVAPRISPEPGTIMLTLHPEVSVITAFVATPGGGNLPQIARRYADTTVRVKDGETIVIGGLLREADIKNIQKVPLLGDLPFFGQLFRRTSTQRDKSEIVIMITVRIVKE